MTRHNKKRNSGLLYELLIRKISRSLVEGDNKSASISKSIVKKYFNAGTELHKEYRLINALVNVPVGSESIATAVLSEAREASKKFDSKALKIEKSNLIREINHEFNKDDFYAESVPNYRMYATASSVIGYWRSEKHLDINTVVDYEKKLIEALSRPTAEFKNEEVDPDVDNLVVKVATNKLQKKYESKLNENQAELINLYAVEADLEKTRKKVQSIKESAIENLNAYVDGKDDSLSRKLSLVIEKIQGLQTEQVDDGLISRTLEIIELSEELKGVSNEALS
tara:strand:- start:107 stop:952 length:846 start_codon:yes stop_codon:yes gene_type:complete